MRRPTALLLLLAACNGGAPSSTTTDVEASSSTGDPCPVGVLDCPCTPGGGCDPGLDCVELVCSEPLPCGELGCSCSEDSCDPGLVCKGGTCKPPLCGDRVVDPGEACDDGNEIAGDGCGPGCTVDACGNDVVEASKGEECEPGLEPAGECAADCTDAKKIIFVTSQMWPGGEMGGVAGGDAKCQALADEAGLPGAFLAWLATSKEDAPLVRFTWSETAKYVDMSGAVLADHWMNIYGSAPPPFWTELGTAVEESEIVDELNGERWFGWMSNLAHAGGGQANPVSCGGWTDPGTVGPTIDLNGSEFVNLWSGADCTWAAPIVCVEQ